MSGKDVLGKHWQWFFISLSVVVGIYLKIMNPWDSVFISWIGTRLSGNDPWFYYRLVENCLNNFPSRIWFDAFTNYPYGTYTHFGPFLVYFGVILAKLAGASDSESIRHVLAFIPAIGGILLVFPVYLLTKEIFDKKAGVIAALLVIIVPGQLLHRSILSFNDHHIWEVFWMITTLAIFTYSVNLWKGSSMQENIKNRNSILAPIFAGIVLGAYLDTWAPGFIVGLIILFYVFLVYLLKKWLATETENLAGIGIIMFLVAALVYLPFSFKYHMFSTVKYSPFQLLLLILSAGVLTTFYFLDTLGKKGYYRKLGVKEEYGFTLIILVIGLIMIAGVALIAPEFFGKLANIVGVLQKKGGALTVAEIQPFFNQGGQFSLAPAWYHFSMTFFFAIPGMIYTIYLFVRERKSSYLLVLIWGFAMLIALAGQNRFAYYFGVVSAFFAAVMLDTLLRKFRFYDAIGSIISNNSRELKRIGYGKIVISILIVFILFYPTFVAADEQSKNAVGGINKQWYSTLVWMRENTPNKEMYEKFYYEHYKQPENPKEPYPYYPEGVYGVMSWWDYGHWITAIAHRIPNANPFQQGIGNKYNHVPGSAPFFTAFNESEANEIADKLGVKFVVSDVEMATGKFYAMAVWAEGTLEKAGKMYYAGPGYVYITPTGQLGIAFSKLNIPAGAKVLTVLNTPSENYYRTMEAKLHIMDGNGLKRYRMVYESEFEAKNGLTIELLYRYIYDSIYAKGNFVPVTSTGYVKVFEYVKGAKITGKVGNVTEVKISTTITTNQNRTFVYQQTTTVNNGVFEFTVPYAQDTVYPVKATEYTITAGKMTKTVSISDEDVENGNVIRVDFT